MLAKLNVSSVLSTGAAQCRGFLQLPDLPHEQEQGARLGTGIVPHADGAERGGSIRFKKIHFDLFFLFYLSSTLHVLAFPYAQTPFPESSLGSKHWNLSNKPRVLKVMKHFL